MIQDLTLLKRGSVKNLWGTIPGKNEIVFEFTDDFSVFDWGKMPDPIPGKGEALRGLAAHLFRELAQPRSWRSFFNSDTGKKIGASTSELRRELESVGMRSCFRGEYLSAEGKPLGLRVEYLSTEKNAESRLIPLEVVFRHSLTDKSSFFERNPKTTLTPGYCFETPLIEYFTKLEPIDRFLETSEEIQRVGQISDGIRRELEQRSVLLSLWLKRECECRELELVDGKFEWGLDREGRITLADAIGPDELRLVERRKGFSIDPSNPTRLSKEFLREYYRDSQWYNEISNLKKQGTLEEGWQSKVQAAVPVLPRDALSRATALYRGIENRFRPQNVLLFGWGAREHAIADRLLDSPNLRTLIWAPGNDAGWAALEKRVSPHQKLVRWKEGYSNEMSETLIEKAREERTSLVVFSQDSDLANGAADRFRAAGFSVFGPSRAAAQVEWSKGFTKDLCQATGVPTAKAWKTTSVDETVELLETLDWSDGKKYVVKADGLASGKGVALPETPKEAIQATEELARFGSTFLVEERLTGVESSWFAFVDGETFSLLDPAKDYKRLFDGQNGPNTGGMGSISPSPDATPALREKVRGDVFAPIVAELARRGIHYQGLLYAGLIADSTQVALLEFNARFGDPETQALLPRMETDLLEWFSAVANGTLKDLPRDVPFREETAVYVVAASAGYPESPEIGKPIPISEEVLADRAFRFAGLRFEKKDWTTSGGRVFGVLGFGKTPDEARRNAYGKLERGIFSGMHFRKDIGR